MSHINELGIFKVKFNGINVKEASGRSKGSTYLEFKDYQGRTTSSRLGNPLNKSDFYRISELLKSLGVDVKAVDLEPHGQAVIFERLKAYIGQELLITNVPAEHSGKVYWNAESFINKRFEINMGVTSGSTGSFSGGSGPLPF